MDISRYIHRVMIHSHIEGHTSVIISHIGYMQTSLITLKTREPRFYWRLCGIRAYTHYITLHTYVQCTYIHLYTHVWDYTIYIWYVLLQMFRKIQIQWLVLCEVLIQASVLHHTPYADTTLYDLYCAHYIIKHYIMDSL